RTLRRGRTVMRCGRWRSRGFALGLDEFAVDQAFRDLNGIERRALAQVVRHAPQHQPVVDRGILADAADVGCILARRLIGRSVATRLALVDDEAAGSVAQELARLVRVDRVLELDVYRLRMADK